MFNRPKLELKTHYEIADDDKSATITFTVPIPELEFNEGRVCEYTGKLSERLHELVKKELGLE